MFLFINFIEKIKYNYVIHLYIDHYLLVSTYQAVLWRLLSKIPQVLVQKFPTKSWILIFFFFPKQINFFFNFLLSFFFFLCNCFRFLFCFVFPPPYWHLNSTHGWKHFSENSSPKKNKQLKIFCFFFFLLNSLQDWLTAIHIQQRLPTDVILKNQTTAKNIRALCMQNKYSALLFFCIWKHYLLLDIYVQVDNFF